MNEPHCPTCICGRRAPVQATRGVRGPGTIAWEEHLRAWTVYAATYGGGCQSAERIAERSGFDWRELVGLLGAEPTTWEPVR